MPTKRALLTVEIDFDDTITDPESMASAMDSLLKTALSTPGVLEEYGNPRIGDFIAPQAIHTAAVEHEDGLNIYAALSDEELTEQLAAYCRKWWDDIRLSSPDELPEEPPEDDEKCVETYFEVTSERGWDGEYLTIDATILQDALLETVS